MNSMEAQRYKESMDRRLLILYGILCLVVLLVVVFFNWTLDKAQSDRQRFEVAVIENCERNQSNTRAFNTLLDKLIDRVKASDQLTQAQIDEAVKFYDSGRQDVPQCPPPSVD